MFSIRSIAIQKKGNKCGSQTIQLPFVRFTTGFDPLDLELDVVIQPSYEWLWKDQEDYQVGIARGFLVGEWPDWRQDPGRNATKFPKNWYKI
jgi:hypothetical protein